MKNIFWVLVFAYIHADAESFVGLHYIGAVPTNKFFSRPIDYCHGMALERFTTNLLESSSTNKSLYLGGTIDFYTSKGINENVQLAAINTPFQTLILKRDGIGLSLNVRCAFDGFKTKPYAQLSVGKRWCMSSLLLNTGDSTIPDMKYNSDSWGTFCGIACGVLLPILENLKLDLGVQYNIGVNAPLYDLNSVQSVNNALLVNTQNSSTSNFQVKVGFFIFVNRPLNLSGNQLRFRPKMIHMQQRN